MEIKAGNRKFRISMLDIIIVLLVILLALGCVIIKTHKSSSNSAAYTQVYTIEINGISDSTQGKINPGDPIIDKIKRLDMGEVTAVQYAPLTDLTDNIAVGERVEYAVPGKTKAIITMTAECVDTGSSIQTTGGYTLAVGSEVFILGPGYSGAGYVIGMDRSVN